jgi:RNA polymerase sigma-70 factor, ECF subfamily
MSDVIVPLSRGHSPSTSMTLLGMANAGDREAWDRIVFLYSPLVDRWCRARNLNPDIIQGIGQEVFLTLFRNLGRFRKDEPGQGFRPWLWTITKNKIADHFIQIRDEPRCVGGSEAREALENYPGAVSTSESGGGSAAPTDRVILLRRCLEAVKSDFEPRTYQAFWEVVMEGKPPAEVARTMAMKSVGAVHTARSRVMRRLRELFEELGPEISGL